MQHYKLNLSDGEVATMTLDETVTTIEIEIEKLGGVINKLVVPGDLSSGTVDVDIESYQLIS